MPMLTLSQIWPVGGRFKALQPPSHGLWETLQGCRQMGGVIRFAFLMNCSGWGMENAVEDIIFRAEWWNKSSESTGSYRRLGLFIFLVSVCVCIFVLCFCLFCVWGQCVGSVWVCVGLCLSFIWMHSFLNSVYFLPNSCTPIPLEILWKSFSFTMIISLQKHNWIQILNTVSTITGFLMKMCIIVFEATKRGREKKRAVNQNNIFSLPPVKSLCGITQSLLGCLLRGVRNRTGPLCSDKRWFPVLQRGRSLLRSGFSHLEICQVFPAGRAQLESWWETGTRKGQEICSDPFTGVQSNNSYWSQGLDMQLGARGAMPAKNHGVRLRGALLTVPLLLVGVFLSMNLPHCPRPSFSSMQPSWADYGDSQQQWQAWHKLPA